MFFTPNRENHEERLLKTLKSFRPSGRGLWHDTSEEDWNNWRWQLKNRVSSLEQLQQHIPNLSQKEIDGARLADTKLAWRLRLIS